MTWRLAPIISGKLRQSLVATRVNHRWQVAAIIGGDSRQSSVATLIKFESRMIYLHAIPMCWWTGGRFIRNDLPASQWPLYEDLRILAATMLAQISRDGRGMMSAREKSTNPWTIAHDDRPALVAILIALIDETATECRARYPESAHIAAAIAKRANESSFIVEYDRMFYDAPPFVRQVATHLQTNMRQSSNGSRQYRLPADLVWRIKILGDILNDTGANYAGCINRNQHIAAEAGLNLSFSITYIKTCIGMSL